MTDLKWLEWQVNGKVIWQASLEEFSRLEKLDYPTLTTLLDAYEENERSK